MRSTWGAAAMGFALACACASSQTGATGKGAPSAAPPPATPTTSGAAPAATAARRPMTAAEAADEAHEEWSRSRGSGGDSARANPDAGERPAPPQASGPDDAPCANDADCTLTRVAPGSCCASLCSPRAVTRRRGAELEQRSAGCRGCVEPLCRDPGRVEATCSAGRCVAQRAASPD